MTWELGVVVAAVAVFFGLRLTARWWIINRWIDGRLTSVQTGALLALIYLAPMLILVVSALVAVPQSVDAVFLVIALVGAPLVAVLGGLLDFATIHGVKEQLTRKRQADLARSRR